MKTTLTLLAALALTACASPDYAQYAKAQESIAASKSQSDAARYRAMSDIAAQGDSAAKVAAVMALAIGQSAPSQQIAAPQPNQALQWASILVPGLTQIYGIRANADVAMRSSDNAAATSAATTAGFVGIAGKIQAAGPSYTYGANSGTNSGNSGRLAGTTMMDATSAPTVVYQPDPVVVQPVIVDPVVVQVPTP